MLFSVAGLIGCGQATQLLKLKSTQSTVSVISLEGKAAKSGRPLASGDHVMDGETVVTEDGAVAVFKMEGQASLRLQNGAKLVFDHVTDTISLNLDYGNLMLVVRRANRPFVLTTPAATVGVRGTAFYVESRAIDQTYVCLCEGVLTLNTPDTTQVIRAESREHHTPMLISPDKLGRLTASPSAMINHTNADIADLEAVLK